MKNKSVKMVLAVAILAVSCGAYAGVKNYASKQDEQVEGTKENSTNVISVSENEIKSVGFLIDKSEVTFEKNGDSWTKQDEKDFPVNQVMLENAVSSLGSVETDRILENVENLEQYGLSEPSNTIKIVFEKEKAEDAKTSAEGEGTITLRIGDKNESTNQYYVSKDEDRNTVYLVNSAIVEPFMKELYDYAQREDFPAISGTDIIKKISVTGETIASYELEKEDAGIWNISSDKGCEKADSAKASSLATSLGSMTYDTFVDYKCEDKREYGLDKPYAVINVDYQEEIAAAVEENENADADTEEANADMNAESPTEETPEETERTTESVKSAAPETIEKQLVIAVGDETENGDRYISVNDSNQIYTMSEETLSAFLGKTEADFWDMTVSYLPVAQLDEIDITYQNEIYKINVSRETFENEEGKEEEKVTYLLDGTEMDEVNFSTFYNKLINMTGQRRLTEKIKPGAEAEMKIAFTSDDGSKTMVEYYAYDTNYYAAVVGEKTYLVNKMNVKTLFSSLETLIAEK